MGISTVNHMEIEIWNLIGLCHYQLDEYEAAVVAFNEGMKIGDGSADLLVNRALAHEALEQIDFAKADYTSALNMVPEHESASLNMLRLQSESEQMELVNSFIATHPNQPQGFTKRGLMHYNNLDYESAEKDFEVAFELSPEKNDYLFNFALAKLKTGKLKESEEYFLVLVERDPRRAAGYFNLGNIHYALESFEEACSYYTLAIQLEPNTPSYLYNRALAYYENGQQEKACADMGRAHLLNPEVGNDFLIKYCSSY
jgi:tetratricopeptide (TPR) repeat protein